MSSLTRSTAVCRSLMTGKMRTPQLQARGWGAQGRGGRGHCKLRHCTSTAMWMLVVRRVLDVPGENQPYDLQPPCLPLTLRVSATTIPTPTSPAPPSSSAAAAEVDPLAQARRVGNDFDTLSPQFRGMGMTLNLEQYTPLGIVPSHIISEPNTTKGALPNVSLVVLQPKDL